jgi:hypothetical protein
VFQLQLKYLRLYFAQYLLVGHDCHLSNHKHLNDLFLQCHWVGIRPNY